MAEAFLDGYEGFINEGRRRRNNSLCTARQAALAGLEVGGLEFVTVILDC
jgi:hypothetical protein